MKISILRLGHRKKRDVRVTTHCCLVARAFFASDVTFSGESDESLEKTIKSVSKNWGGKFKIKYDPNWKKFLLSRKKRGDLIVHLTMYGKNFQESLPEIQKLSKKHNLLVIIGAEKGPGEVYRISDFNLSVTNQPHSEVAALAIFLNELQNHSPLKNVAQTHFKSAKIKIIPGQKGGKRA
ncbi:MAG: tRNA (cytidine(56)-2'-O)-methyltransferase [Candidatus Micrarchaeota archaeon]